MWASFAVGVGYTCLNSAFGWIAPTTAGAAAMLASMAVAATCFFALYFGLRESLGNHALWLAFIAYLATRGIVLAFLGRTMEKKAFR